MAAMMNEHDLKHYLEIYGGDFRRWPRHLADEALNLLENSPELMERVEIERGFEDWLRVRKFDDAGEDLAQRIIGSAQNMPQRQDSAVEKGPRPVDDHILKSVENMTVGQDIMPEERYEPNKSDLRKQRREHRDRNAYVVWMRVPVQAMVLLIALFAGTWAGYEGYDYSAYNQMNAETMHVQPAEFLNVQTWTVDEGDLI